MDSEISEKEFQNRLNFSLKNGWTCAPYDYIIREKELHQWQELQQIVND